jgi:ABC-2 type transport system ATP-binding protein
LSFTVEPGEIFGLLGPNGAGKTTTIRMALDLFKPDSGAIEIFGGPLDERKKDRIGYMPETRGLYEDMELLDCIVFLATLKGLGRKEARARAQGALTKMELWDDRKKKVGKFSRGMTQKAQIIVATLHDPDLLIVDEPFANLDPVNVDLAKSILLDMRARGKAIIMSSHQLHLVETLCDRIMLIDKGRRIVYGSVREVKQQFAENEVLVAGEGNFQGLPGVASVAPVGKNGLHRLRLQTGTTPREVFRALAARPETIVEHFEIALPSLDEVFIKAVNEARDA